MLAGCGTTKTRNATEQLLISDAVDRSIAVIDFAPLAGKTVYFDTKYLVTVKGVKIGLRGVLRVVVEIIISGDRIGTQQETQEDRDGACREISQPAEEPKVRS